MEGFRSRSYTDGRSQIEPYGLYGPPVHPMTSEERETMVGGAEFQRKKRVAGYKVYSVEGKLKASFRKSIRWLKERYNHVVYGW
ncbi:hypothetical protein HPP92_008945 [Vanilla planifolia]|uniref:Uncharacterized protein n=1 Tax=Vanilla planifolia TaxID=51239 RepID=A0A835V7P9_VANPL|nr:hypothetical protein HPP92_008945 [Vanilla planifolia]